MDRKYVSGGGRLSSSGQSGWYWPSFLGDTFWSVLNVIFLFFKTLVSPGKGDSSTTSSSGWGRGNGPGPGGPRRMGRVRHGGGPSPPPMGGGG
ncbi:selenoprotein K-like [Dysidea avara]|uniref:selenoprotein K-like n=1 Tax=Dysidea avara TaxID=196820 RepID=UPI0033221673